MFENFIRKQYAFDSGMGAGVKPALPKKLRDKLILSDAVAISGIFHIVKSDENSVTVDLFDSNGIRLGDIDISKSTNRKGAIQNIHFPGPIDYERIDGREIEIRLYKSGEYSGYTSFGTYLLFLT